MRYTDANRGAVDNSAEDNTVLLSAYHHLMEIYCAVKAGGVEGQIEAAQALLAREKVALEAEIAALDSAESGQNQISLLKQEIIELERAANWRISMLKKIQTEEEKAVGNCLPEIEAALDFSNKDRTLNPD